jgi:hypothetical protein
MKYNVRENQFVPLLHQRFYIIPVGRILHQYKEVYTGIDSFVPVRSLFTGKEEL